MKWSSPHCQQKSLKCCTRMQSQKQQNDPHSFLRQTIQDHSNPSLCPNSWRHWSWMVLWRPIRPSRTNTPKGVLFTLGGWNAKLGGQEIPGVTGKFGLAVQSEAGQRLTEFCQENALVIANTLYQQHKRRFYTRTSPGDQYRNKIDYIHCSQRWRNSIQSAKTRPGADCGSDHELLIAKFRLNLKKVGKTVRPFRYDLNQIPCNNTVEVKNRLKVLDLIDKVLEELWMELHDCTGSSDQDHPQEKEMQKGKTAATEALQTAEKRREVKGKGENERYTHFNA